MTEDSETPAGDVAAAPSAETTPADTPPDRLSVNPRSEFHAPDLLARGVGIMFNGTERTNVEEYCVSEGWIKVAAGASRDRYGNPLTIKVKGEVKPWFKS
jgi:hypothetical protein